MDLTMVGDLRKSMNWHRTVKCFITGCVTVVKASFNYGLYLTQIPASANVQAEVLEQPT